jgi:hypothetical protein
MTKLFDRITLWLLLFLPRFCAYVLVLTYGSIDREQLFRVANGIRGCIFVRPHETVELSGHYLFVYTEGRVRVRSEKKLYVDGELRAGPGGALTCEIVEFRKNGFSLL